MNLLVITQKVDRDDPILGFFHGWLIELAKRYDALTVICLQQGTYQLPANVHVLSLGKEDGKSRFKYIARLYQYVWQERNNFDAVFVHMNQEYVLLAGIPMRCLGKKIYLWRNHVKGNVFTTIAVLLSHKVFCTSPSAYTAKFKKTMRMPVGIDTEYFRSSPAVRRIPHSVLFLGRIAPVKKVLEFIEWIHAKCVRGEECVVTIVGAAASTDAEYEQLVHQKIQEYGLSNKITFVGAVQQSGALQYYQSHETYVNMTPAGSFDKTIFEAAACEMNIVVQNTDIEHIFVGKSGQEARAYVVGHHSLAQLMDMLQRVI